MLVCWVGCDSTKPAEGFPAPHLSVSLLQVWLLSLCTFVLLLLFIYLWNRQQALLCVHAQPKKNKTGKLTAMLMLEVDILSSHHWDVTVSVSNAVSLLVFFCLWLVMGLVWL